MNAVKFMNYKIYSQATYISVKCEKESYHQIELIILIPCYAVI